MSMVFFQTLSANTEQTGRGKRAVTTEAIQLQHQHTVQLITT